MSLTSSASAIAGSVGSVTIVEVAPLFATASIPLIMRRSSSVIASLVSRSISTCPRWSRMMSFRMCLASLWFGHLRLHQRFHDIPQRRQLLEPGRNEPGWYGLLVLRPQVLPEEEPVHRVLEPEALAEDLDLVNQRLRRGRDAGDRNGIGVDRRQGGRR